MQSRQVRAESRSFFSVQSTHDVSFLRVLAVTLIYFAMNWEPETEPVLLNARRKKDLESESHLHLPWVWYHSLCWPFRALRTFFALPWGYRRLTFRHPHKLTSTWLWSESYVPPQICCDLVVPHAWNFSYGLAMLVALCTWSSEQSSNMTFICSSQYTHFLLNNAQQHCVKAGMGCCSFTGKLLLWYFKLEWQ